MRHDSGHFTPTKARGLWRAALLGGVLAWGGISQAQTNALSFDGVDDRVSCGTNPSLNLTGNAVTLEAWIYPTSWRTEVYQGNIINKEQDSNNSGYMLRCGANGTLNFNVGGEGEWHEVNSAANALTLNTWQHVAGVYDGSTLHLYLNGVEITTDAVSFNVGNSTNPLVIGDWADGTGRNYPGLIDEVRVWNKAVDGATLLANMNTKYCGNETGLIAYYRFDQGTADGTNTTETTLNDQTGYANNGTLSGFALDGTSSNWVSGQTNMADCVPIACPSPILLTISNASTSGFDLTWTDTEASSYEYEVRTAGAAGSGATGLFTSGTVATGATPVAINGIAANTTYQAYVRASCDGGIFSDWSPAASIYTGYCNPAPTSVDGNGITNVTFGGVNNTTGSEPGHYADYTSMVGTVQQSTIATVDITFATAYTYGTKIWVDINNDFDFDDAGELVYTGLSTNANPTTLTATFPVGTMSLGQHRMRIGGTDNDNGPSGPCYSGSYGTFEDYTLMVDPAPDCVAPMGLTAAATSTTDGMAIWNVSSPVPAGGYDVYYSIDATSPDDATVPNFTAVADTFQVLSGLPQGVAIHVWVRSHCSDASLSAWSVRVDLVTNDDCLGAISCTVNPDQSCAVTTPGTVAGATGSGLSTTCFGTPDDDVWFSFVATGTSQMVSLINSSGSTTDLYHALWSGADCSSLSLVAGSCSDGDVSTYSGLVVGETYYVQVYTYTSTPGQNTVFDVCIGTPPLPPANDECDGAYPVAVNPYNYDCMTPTAGTVAGATASGLSTTCFGTPNDDVWFTFVATSTEHRISLTNITGSTSDMYMALWTGDCGSLALVPGSCSDPQTLNMTGLTVGTTYYLQVYSYTSSSGQTSAFDVCIGTPPTCFPPENITLDSFTAPDASISWDDNGAVSFDYEVRTSGAPGSGATGLVQSGNVAGSPLSLSGLNATDVYSVYIHSNCSDVNISSWSSPVSLYTGYCPPTSTSATYYLTDFSTTGGTDNITNTNSGLSANGYGDFTDMVVSQYPGSSFDFSAGFATTSTYYLYIWVDWNNDLDFDDDGEQVVATANYQSSPYSGSIAVPEGTPAGDYRMRVRNSELGVVGPCGSVNYGEAEDYTLTVLPPAACAGMPDPGATTGPTVICADVPFTLSVENVVIEGGLNYQWQISSDGVSWTDAPGSSTLSHYTTSQTVETWYQLQVTCEFGSVATSTPLDVTMAPPTECYCTTLNYTNNVEPICNVTFADINNDSPSAVNGTPQVEDFTTIVGHVTQGNTYTLSVTGNTDGNYTTYITAFFDWDGNGSWETVTPIGTIVNDDCATPTTGDITVPVDALVGTSRMRVVKLFNASPTDPCATYSFGQTEDYTLDVSAPVLDCEGTVDGPALPGTPCIYAPSGYGGMWSADCVCIENVGVGEIAGNTGFAIYPNPASSILYITTANNAPVHVKVYDMVGTLVMEKDMVQQLNITKLATGSYTLVATDSKGMNERRARFMKQ